LLTDTPKAHMVQANFMNIVTLKMRMCYILVNKMTHT